ncbi:MAG: heat-inducible transcription repressor HrcA [Oscillospiraceae bacterium]|nr:heat-inducible transcription repressor HrcA [Oscillospiraceae bacterium]
MKLDNRKAKILEFIIDMYIKSGEPVSSKTISELFQNTISSATIRNEMARLYELGFLEQPHTSAGRVPSQLGYRLYVDQIMKKKSLSEEQTRQIESWFNIRDLDYSSLIKNSGKILSEITSCMTILSSMAFKSLIITKIEIIEVSNMALAVILVTSSGIIKSKVCKVDFDINFETLDYIYRFVNNTFAGKSVEKISKNYINSITTGLDNYQSFFSPIFYNIYEMCESLQTSDFYIDGQINLLLYKELKDVASDIIKIFSNKNTVIDIINDKFINLSDNCGAAVIKFGRELKRAELIDICLIISKYNISNIGTGNILIVGPGRLNYSVLVPWIEYFSKMLSVVLSESLEIK